MRTDQYPHQIFDNLIFPKAFHRNYGFIKSLIVFTEVKWGGLVTTFLLYYMYIEHGLYAFM